MDNRKRNLPHKSTSLKQIIFHLTFAYPTTYPPLNSHPSFNLAVNIDQLGPTIFQNPINIKITVKS
ncbi:hypothetical protein U9M48_037527 [Paspalum notatum var. saurae]|uniref:Uncharacterized protein n=1 Tax=Paspalum notatum var. saurae TaxID=547442 RepID=A0AAQ3UGL4_PASNO